MEESEFVNHLCTPRYHPTDTTTTTTINNNNNHHHHHFINDSYYGRKRSKRKRTRSLTRSKSQHDVRRGADHPPALPGNTNPELSVDTRAPGLLKIFGESVVAGTQYKSVLASTRSTAQELIKQALERFGIASGLYRDFVLCESIGKTLSADSYCDEGDFHCHTKNSNHKKSKDKKGGGVGGGGGVSVTSNTTSSPSLSFHSSSGVIVEGNELLLSSNSNPNTPRSARSLHNKPLKKLLNDKSPCGSPRGNCDSPRTPLGSPRTSYGSPSTSRGSPRTSVVCDNVGKSSQEEFELLNYRPPKVLDSNSFGNPHLHQLYHHKQQRLISKSNKNGIIDSPRINKFGHESPRHPREGNNNVQTPRQSNGSAAVQSSNDVSRQSLGDWIQVYFRVLCYSDRPLELQEFWKPPEGLSRRYELKRRRDVMMDAVENETTGLNENARKIMISKISPGVIPFNEVQEKAPEARTVLRDEWNRAASALTNASLTYTDDNDGILTNVVEGDARQAYICPSIYPYLLTLRGCSIQKDLVLYPLKSRSLSIGSAEKKAHGDDIQLSSPDVSPAHCRVTLKRLPQDGKSVDESKRIYWYCIDLEIFASSFVTVNGIQVRQKSTVFPGDLLGIGRQYLFLYKDPTGGHDIPSAVPWLPENETEASAIYSQVIRHQQNESRDASGPSLPQPHQRPRSREIDTQHLDVPYQDEDSNVLDDSAARETAIFLAYHRDKEMELFECIAEVDCHSNKDYPLSQALLFLASHQYAARKFSGSHQSTFFKRLVRVVRARVGAVSKLVSQQKHESRVFNTDNPTKKISPSHEVDYFPCLVNWLSTVLTLMSHCRTNQFQTFVSSLARRSDVIKSVQEAVGYFEETVSFLFQQVVYSVTKVLYDPINKFMQGAIPNNTTPCHQALERILGILRAVQRLVLDLLVDRDVANQLMVYLLFFVSTTLFNRIIAKGSKLYNRESGVVLQEGVSALEGWSREAGLEPEFMRVSEHILSLVDLLSSSKRSLLRLDWPGFQTQFSPLTDVQLCKLLGEYDLRDGVTAPDSWHPSYPVDPKQGDLTVSLSSHPAFVLPTRGEQVNLQDTFPASFYRHLELVQQRFSLVGEDAYYSGLSSAGNTPRLSEPVNRSGGNLETFFSQDPNASISGSSLHPKHFQNDLKPQVTKIEGDYNHIHQNPSHKSTTKRIPPQTAPKPKRSQHTTQGNQTKGTGAVAASNQSRATAPPPYNMAIKLKQAQSHDNSSKILASYKDDSNDESNTDGSNVHKSSRGQPVLHFQNSTDPNNTETKLKNTALHSNLQKFQTLPDNIKDKLFSSSNSASSSSHTNCGPHSHRGKSAKSSSQRLKTQQSWTPTSQNAVNSHQYNQLMNASDLSSTYPMTRPRPSSATDLQYSLEHSGNVDNTDSSSSPFMNHHQKAELLSTRSNSALGYDMAKTDQNPHNSRNGNYTNYSKQHIQHRQFSTPESPSYSPGRSRNRDHRGDILNPPNHDWIREPTSLNTQHVSPYNYTPRVENVTQDAENDTDKANNAGPFSYGSLKRSPRNTNLSKRTPSDSKINGTTSDNNRVVIKSGNFTSDISDVPPPLPPRGETIRRNPSIESPPQRDSSRERTNYRESPVGSTTSSSGQRPRSGSRTSVEIQDITENQYIIYNPDSPVKEFFDFNQNYLSMVNRNNPPEHSKTQGTVPHPHQDQLEPTRKLTRVPRLELPDDLLGVSENDSQDEVFSGHSGSADNIHRTPNSTTKSRGKPRKMSSIDDYPDDVYIDVNDLSNSDSNASSTLKVLPVGDERRRTSNDPANGVVFVRYRHSMPDVSHDVTSRQGENTAEVFTVTLTKTGNRLGMGLIDGLHTPLKLAGIYVRNVLPDTPAALCGCLRVGDRILSINDNSIMGLDYNSAMKLIHDTGPKLELTVVKGDRAIASKISASTAS